MLEDSTCLLKSVKRLGIFINQLGITNNSVNSSTAEAMYVSNHDQVVLNSEVGSIIIQVGTSMRVLGVMFDSKLSWENYIVHVSNIVKKKIHALRRIL